MFLKLLDIRLDMMFCWYHVFSFFFLSTNHIKLGVNTEISCDLAEGFPMGWSSSCVFFSRFTSWKKHGALNSKAGGLNSKAGEILRLFEGGIHATYVEILWTWFLKILYCLIVNAVENIQHFIKHIYIYRYILYIVTESSLWQKQIHVIEA